MNDRNTTIDEIKQKIKIFVDERDWEQFHNPKDVALAVSIEASEILEHFLWKTKKEVEDFIKDPKSKEELSDELADTLVYLVELARVCNIDLSEAYEKKAEKAARKYPKEVVKGKAHKYTFYEEKEK